MSFVERSGRSSWRVRYWRDDGTHGSIPGFATKRAAEVMAVEPCVKPTVRGRAAKVVINASLRSHAQ